MMLLRLRKQSMQQLRKSNYFSDFIFVDADFDFLDTNVYKEN